MAKRISILAPWHLINGRCPHCGSLQIGVEEDEHHEQSIFCLPCGWRAEYPVKKPPDLNFIHGGIG